MWKKKTGRILVLQAMSTNRLIDKVMVSEHFCIPARLTPEDVAVMLGLPNRDAVTVLVQKRLLQPLGKPAANAPKHFATRDIAKLSNDGEWLNKATQALSNHWSRKNKRRSAKGNE